jgi:hypothetical protein
MPDLTYTESLYPLPIGKLDRGESKERLTPQVQRPKYSTLEMCRCRKVPKQFLYVKELSKLFPKSSRRICVNGCLVPYPAGGEDENHEPIVNERTVVGGVLTEQSQVGNGEFP